MKLNLKKHSLRFSILVSLILGIVFTQTAMSLKYTEASDNNSDIAYSIHATYIGRNLKTYTQEATAIIIGKVIKVSAPYLKKETGMTSQQDVIVDGKEILKGNLKKGDINIVIEGGHTVVKSGKNGIRFISEAEGPLFKPGEEILLFIGKTTEGNYVPFAGPYGKYLIDDAGNVASMGNFKMSLKELKTEIEETLKVMINERKVGTFQ